MQKGQLDYSPFWNETVKQLRDELSDQEYVLWLQRIEYQRSNESEVFVRVPSLFIRDQLKKRYLTTINQKLNELTGTNLEIVLEVNSAVSNKPINGSRANKIIGQRSNQNEASRTHSQLKSEYSFENFVIGANCDFAANASIAIANNPGIIYNPCLIYGSVGLGKTHLIQAIGNQLLRNSAKYKIIYVTTETFTNEFIQSVQHKRTHKFKTHYRQADILLMDDIHFLQKKWGVQEEIFHTFDCMYSANKQLVFTSDRPISEIQDIADRLRSRFTRGLTVDLQPPQYEVRYAIMKKKIEEKNIAIPDDVIELICNNITTNVRDLEAALTRLVAYSDLVGEDIVLDIAKTQLENFFTTKKKEHITIETIQRAVANYFNISVHDLRGKKRTKQMSFPRQLSMYIAREITEFSTTEIGSATGLRDHATVIHGYQRIKERRLSDPTIDETIRHLIDKVKKTGITGAQ